jgi:hypothetical protein
MTNFIPPNKAPPEDEYYLMLPAFKFLKNFFGYKKTTYLINKLKIIYNLFNYIIAFFQRLYIENLLNSNYELKNNFINIKDKTNLLNLSELENSFLNKLEHDGIVIIENYISQKNIDYIFQSLNKKVEILDNANIENYDSKIYPGNNFLNYEEVKNNLSNLTFLNLHKTVPGLNQIIFQETLLKIISNYLGYMPQFNNPIFIRSFPPKKKLIIKDASNWHKDSALDSKYLQVFIYLEDVDLENGPFTFIKKSHQQTFQSFKPLYGYEINKHESQGRVNDDELFSHFSKKDQIFCTGKKGTLVIADTTGFHKGPNWELSKIKNLKERNLINITFSSGSKHLRKKKLEKLRFSSLEKISNTQKLSKILNFYD